jgi:hypothetical protein
MIRKTVLVISLFIVLALTGCQEEENMKDITQITIVSEAGSILPELQWHEEYTITEGHVTFRRSGNADTSDVNSGSWEIPADAHEISDLFLVLETVDLRSIERVEPLDPPDGGGSSYYTITFTNDKSFSLNYNPGVTYTNGELIAKPLQDFLDTLQLPIEAVNRY